MENTLERMVDRIYEEGISRAEQKAAAIVAEAEAKAGEIVARANADAARIVGDAERQASEKKRSTEAELKAAAGRVVSGLRHEISSLLRERLIGAPVKTALADGDFIKDLILGIVKNQQNKDLTITVSEAQKDALLAKLKQAMQAELAGLTIIGDGRKSGFSIAEKGAGYEIEFSDHAMLEFLEPHLKQATAELMR